MSFKRLLLAAVATGKVAGTPATFTVTQLAKADRVYQRSTLTGGGQGKGQGTVAQTINATVVGTVYARRRSVSDGVTIVQAGWLVGTLVATGSQVLNITGVDAPAIGADAATPVVANDGEFYIDLSGDNSTWISGTTPIHMGDCTSMWGQSQLTYLLTRFDAVNIPGTISPYGRVFAEYSGYIPGVGSIVWELPSNTGNYKGAAGAEYMRCMISASGVAHGIVAYAVSGTLISTWQSGQTNMTTLLSVLAAGGGSFRFEYGLIGTTDGQIASADAYFRGALDNSWTAVRGANNFASPVRSVTSIPAVASIITTGDWTMVNTIRQATKTWCSANNSNYVCPLGMKTGDGTHETNATGGGDYLGRELFRSFRSAFGLSGTNNSALTVSSISRVSTTITITLSGAPAAITGSPHRRFRCFYTGNQLQPIAITASAVVGNTITLTLGFNPGDGVALDLYAYTDGYVMIEFATDLSVECFFDQDIKSDETTLGFTKGRQIDFATIGALTVPAPGSGVNAVPAFNITVTSPTYQAGATGFGQELAVGNGLTGTVHQVPQPAIYTLEGWITCPAAPAGNTVMFCGPDKSVWPGFNSSGQLIVGATLVSAAVYTGVGRIFVRICQSATDLKIYVATAQGAAPTLLNTTTFGTAKAAYQVEGSFGIHVTSFGQFANTLTYPVDSLALFSGIISTVAPSASYVGNETGLIALYNCENNGNDNCTN